MSLIHFRIDSLCYSTYRPNKDGSNLFYDTSSKSLFLSLNRSENLLFSGSVIISVCQGEVEFSRYTMSMETPPIELICDKNAPIPVVRVKPRENEGFKLHKIADGVLWNVNGHTAIVRIERANGGADLNVKTFDEIPRDVCEYFRPLREPRHGYCALREFPAPARSIPDVSIVCGSRKSGRRTLCRLLLNELIGRNGAAAFIDVNHNDNEVTPSGLVSLHVLDIPIFGKCFEFVMICYGA